MNNQQKEDRLMISYLLGEASELEQTLVETIYFRDAKYFESMIAMEDELISNYMRGLMSHQEAKQFRQHYLKSARRRQRYETLSELIGCVAQHPSLPQDELVKKRRTVRPLLRKRHARQPQCWL